MRIGFLGVAHIHAQRYGEVVRRVGQVGGVWDREEERARRFAKAFSTVAVAEPEALGEMCDALIIASETVYHPEDGETALKLGLPVLCEKPLAVDAERAAKMVRRFSDAGVLLACAFPFRFLTPFRRIRDLVASGDLGEVVAVYARNRGKQPDGWLCDGRLAGGGAITDHTVHLIDLARWISGQEPEEVFALTAQRDPSLTVEDTALLAVRFSGGLNMTIDCSWSRPRDYPIWGDVGMKLVATGGVVEVEGFGQDVALFGEKKGSHKRVFWGDDMDSLMIEAFVASVEAGRLCAPLAGGEDGYQAQRVVDAAYRSVRSGRVEKVRLC